MPNVFTSRCGDGPQLRLRLSHYEVSWEAGHQSGKVHDFLEVAPRGPKACRAQLLQVQVSEGEQLTEVEHQKIIPNGFRNAIIPPKHFGCNDVRILGHWYDGRKNHSRKFALLGGFF